MTIEFALETEELNGQRHRDRKHESQRSLLGQRQEIVHTHREQRVPSEEEPGVSGGPSAACCIGATVQSWRTISHVMGTRRQRMQTGLPRVTGCSAAFLGLPSPVAGDELGRL